MKTLFSLFLLLSVFSLDSFAQFPDGWMGEWEGDLIIHSQPGDRNQVIKMKLEIIESPLYGIYYWRIFYDDNAGGSWREYTLEVDSIEAGQFRLNEHNSIVLDMFYFNDSFYSMYAVGKGLITARYELKDGKINFEITSANTEGKTTGGEGDVPDVTDYSVHTVQKATLTKIN